MLSFYLSTLETEEERKTMTRIYDKYNKRYNHIAFEVLKNESDTEDAIHNAFLAVIDNKKKCFAMSDSDFGAYFATIVRNKAIDIYRQRKKVILDEFGSLTDEDDKNPVQTMDEFLVNRENYELLRSALKELPLAQEAVLNMKYIEDLSYAEIAERMNTTTKNVDMMLYRAKIKLQKVLTREESAK